MRELLEQLRETLEAVELDERFEPAKVGTVRKWQKGEFKKTSKGWERITKGSGPTRAGEKPALKKKGAAAVSPPTPSKKGAAPPPKKGGGSAPSAPASNKKAGSAKEAPPKKAGASKKPPEKKPKKQPSQPRPKKTPEQEQQVQDTTAKLKKHPDIFPSFRKGWNKMKKAWNGPGLKGQIQDSFMQKLQGEVSETGSMLRTIGKAFIPGVKLNPKDVENARHQFVDIAKSVLVASMATSPLGIVAVGLTAVGIRVDKVIDAFIDRPLRAATLKAFGKEHGLLPTKFYEKPKKKASSGDQPGLSVPGSRKPKVEWVDGDDEDIDDYEEEDDDLDMDEVEQGAQEQASEALAQVMDRVLDLMGEMEPHDEDFSEALIDAGLTPEQIDAFVKYAEMAKLPQYDPQDTSDLRNDDKGEAVSQFRRLAGLMESDV